MKRWLAFLIICIFPAATYSHPGKTDLYGGHKCFKKCENWGLLYDEYHLHDKDGNPIRVAKKKPQRKAPRSRQAVNEVEQSVPQAPTETDVKPTPVSKAAVVPQKERLVLNPLLLALLALLLLLLLLRVRRRRLEQEK
jgi:hypothetical protein